MAGGKWPERPLIFEQKNILAVFPISSTTEIPFGSFVGSKQTGEKVIGRESLADAVEFLLFRQHFFVNRFPCPLLLLILFVVKVVGWACDDGDMVERERRQDTRMARG